MAHFCTPKGEEIDWAKFQKHMDLSDEELEVWKTDPKKKVTGPQMCAWETQRNWLIIEVVYSHGCGNGLRVGDRLCFEGMGCLDPTRSSRWCPHAMGWISGWTDGMHNLVFNGIDPAKFYPQTFSCGDSTQKYGWGQVIFKAYVVTREELDKLPPIPPITTLDDYFPDATPTKGMCNMCNTFKRF